MLPGHPAEFDMAPSYDHVQTALDVYFFPKTADIHW